MRIEVGVATPFQTTFYAPGTEEPADADAPVTYTVKHVNGTQIATGTATSGGLGSGAYTFTLPAQSVPMAASVVWSGEWSGNTQTRTEYFEAVGRFMVDLWELRQMQDLGNKNTYPTSLLIAKREAAEDLFEQVTNSWTEKYALDVLDGDSTYRRAYMPTATWSPWEYDRSRRLMLTHKRPQTILAVTVNGVTDTAPVGYVGGQSQYLADNYKTYDSGEIERTIGNAGWPRGVENVQIEYVYGRKDAPSELKDALMRYVRYLVLQTTSRVSDRATAYTSPEGGTTMLGTAKAWDAPTGISDIDAVLLRFDERDIAIA